MIRYLHITCENKTYGELTVRLGTAYNACVGFIVVILLPASQAFAQQPEISVKEWVVPTANSAPHDIVVDEKNGVVWFTEINTNKIGMFDPKTEQFQEFVVPTSSSRPHGLVVDDNGNIWFTEMAASKIGKLDTVTKKISEFPTPTPNSGPHTPIMGEGVVWFTEIDASNIGRLNLTTGTIDEFPTPTRGSSPYGIIVDPEGNAWYAGLTGHVIGKVDAKSGEITEYPTPTSDSGTRRIAIDSNGKLWFTEFNTAKIGSFDPKTNEFKEYETISQSSNPYAIWVDIYDNVWFSMTGTFKVGKFDQSTNTTKEYDLPTPRTIIRFIYSDKEGSIWFPDSNNNKIGVIMQSQVQQPTSVCDNLDDHVIDKYNVTIGEQSYSGRYVGSISNVTTNFQKSSLEIFVPDKTGCLLIELPRNLIDAKKNDSDTQFVVLVDGSSGNFSEVNTNQNENRQLKIELPTEGLKKVEIIGTNLSPEFRPFLGLTITAAGVAGIICLRRWIARC